MTPAEEEVVRLRATGLTVKEIAVLLGKSHYTVHEQLASARMRSNGEQGRAQIGKPPALTPEQRAEVYRIEAERRALPTPKQLAAKFGVSKETIYRAIRDPNYKHDTCPVYRARVGE